VEAEEMTLYQKAYDCALKKIELGDHMFDENKDPYSALKYYWDAYTYIQNILNQKTKSSDFLDIEVTREKLESKISECRDLIEILGGIEDGKQVDGTRKSGKCKK
jgi:hypothetical protein